MNKICSFIRFKAKEGCEDEFLAELKAANMELSYFLSWQIVSLGDREFIQALVYEDIENVMEMQDVGDAFLNRVEHLLERYEDGSRTNAFSGIVVQEGKTE